MHVTIVSIMQDVPEGSRDVLESILRDCFVKPPASWLRDELADVAIRSIEQVGAGFPALAPLVAQLNADGLMELEEVISAKVDDVLATVELWKQSESSAPRRGLARSLGFSPDVTDRIADALLDIPSMADNDTRTVILSILPVQLRGSIRYSPAPRIQVYNIVQACSYQEEGLRQLVRAIRSVERLYSYASAR